MDCIYTESKNYPRELAAHVAIRTVCHFIEKQKDKIKAVVFCTSTESDTEIYKRFLPLYFPRDKHEEEEAISKLPADVGDENEETIIDERKIRIKPLPTKAAAKPPQRLPQAPEDLPGSDVGLVRSSRTDLGWILRLQQILGHKHQHNLHAIYILHPTFHMKATVFTMQILVDNVAWKKVVYADRLLQLFRYFPREQLTILDFVFQQDLEVNGVKGLIVDPKTKSVHHRP